MMGGFYDLLAWLLGWKSSPLPPVAGPYRVAMGQAHCPGAAAGQAFCTGAETGEVKV